MIELYQRLRSFDVPLPISFVKVVEAQHPPTLCCQGIFFLSVYFLLLPRAGAFVGLREVLLAVHFNQQNAFSIEWQLQQQHEVHRPSSSGQHGLSDQPSCGIYFLQQPRGISLVFGNHLISVLRPKADVAMQTCLLAFSSFCPSVELLYSG
jgi:hypothetical protein